MADAITKDMTFSDVLHKYPEAAAIMMGHGLHCVGCHAAVAETIEEGCLAHGMEEKDVEKMIKEMNEAIKK